MDKDLSDFRKSYEKFELVENQISSNPIELFQQWFFDAENSPSDLEPNAMNIATIGLDGFPKSRIVLLKRFTWEGFVFYTNYNSEKGKAIENNPNVCASFFWHSLERQVIIKGKVEKISENLSDGYFESRPRGSQLGAWASNQSSVVSNREVLVTEIEKLTEIYQNKEIPRPKHWGGYIIKPVSIEFWQGRPNRLHDRIRYSLQENFEWKIERLAP